MLVSMSDKEIKRLSVLQEICDQHISIQIYALKKDLYQKVLFNFQINKLPLQ
ncbi:hypothetical protein QAC21B_03903 [Acinetobacter bohemicus]|nr:hypothetical protein QAC21B_03903 [Acinetobacter bohemicus]